MGWESISLKTERTNPKFSSNIDLAVYASFRCAVMRWTKLGRTNKDSKWLYTGVCMQLGRKEPEEDLLYA